MENDKNAEDSNDPKSKMGSKKTKTTEKVGISALGFKLFNIIFCCFNIIRLLCCIQVIKAECLLLYTVWRYNIFILSLSSKG